MLLFQLLYMCSQFFIITKCWGGKWTERHRELYRRLFQRAVLQRGAKICVVVSMGGVVKSVWLGLNMGKIIACW